jgi:hypothetical protein
MNTPSQIIKNLNLGKEISGKKGNLLHMIVQKSSKYMTGKKIIYNHPSKDKVSKFQIIISLLGQPASTIIYEISIVKYTRKINSNPQP